MIPDESAETIGAFNEGPGTLCANILKVVEDVPEVEPPVDLIT